MFDSPELNACFDGNGQVIVIRRTLTGLSHSTKLVKDLIAGDYVYTGTDDPDGTKLFSKIRCIVKYDKHIAADVVSVNKGDLFIKLTPWHPIYCDNRWVFPNDLVGPGRSQTTYLNTTFTSELYIGTFYNLVLHDIHSVSINGVRIITLAHGFTDPVAEHEYFGTHRILHDLNKIPGWKDGLVDITAYTFERCKKTQLINKLTKD